jgi:hypothetical protein
LIHDYCLSALLILSSRIGCYRFCGCFVLPSHTQNGFLFNINVLLIKNSILEASLPSSPALAREQQPADLLVSSALIRASRSLRCRASTFLRPQGWRRQRQRRQRRRRRRLPFASTMLLHFIRQMFIKFRHLLCQMFFYTFLKLTFPHKMDTQLLHSVLLPFFICQMFVKRLFLPFLSPPLVRVLLHSSTTNFSSQNGHSAFHSVLFQFFIFLNEHKKVLSPFIQRREQVGSQSQSLAPSPPRSPPDGS